MRFIAVVFLLMALLFAFYKLNPLNRDQMYPATLVHADKLILEENISKIEVINLERKHSIPRPEMFLTSYSQENEVPNLDIYPEWEDELYGILQHLDPEKGDDVFTRYKEEKQKHADEINLNLIVEINNLSLLNGESIEKEVLEETSQYSSNLEMLEINHQKRIKQILGEHYEYVHTQYELSKEINVN